MLLRTKLIIGVSLSAALFGAGFFVGDMRRSTDISELEMRAQQAEGEARMYAALAEVQENTIRDANERIEVAKSKEAASTGESQALRRKLADLYAHYNANQPNTSGGVDGSNPGASGDDSPCLQLQAICENQRLLIDSLDKEIAAKDEKDKAKDLKIIGLETQSQYWKKAYESESLRANLLNVALQAQKSAAKAERWKGRIEGAGVASLVSVTYYFVRVR